jgi:2,5-diamino-6-(ribosylamino)-4(3H)-pyrimidinone 5'-phosphate reductase
MNRPFVFVNMAATVDGKITSAAREYPLFASAMDRRRMDLRRAEADALLVGAGTLRADDPPLWLRDPEARQYRASLGRPPELTRVVVTRGGELPATSRFFDERDGGDRIVAVPEELPEARLSGLGGAATIWRCGTGQVDLPGLLLRLKQRGIERLLLEGGGELNWQFLEADLIDELYVTVAPALLGGRDSPTIVEGRGLPMAGQRRLRLLEVDRHDDELFCRWAVVREES